MARQFIMLTQEEIDDRVAANIKSRESELMSYDFEKAHHEEAIATIGNLEWPENLLKYRGLARDAMIAKATADGLDGAAISQISNLMALDYHKHNLQAVNVETSKSERHYDHLLTKLPDGERRASAITRLQAKEEAEKAK